MLAGTVAIYNSQTGRVAVDVDGSYTVFEVKDDWQPKLGSKVYGDDLHNLWEGSLRTESEGNTRIYVIEIFCNAQRVRVLVDEKPENWSDKG